MPWRQDSGHSQEVAWGPVPFRPEPGILTALGAMISTSSTSGHPQWGLPLTAYLLSPFLCSLSPEYDLCNWFVIVESKMGVYWGSFPEGGVTEPLGLLSPSLLPGGSHRWTPRGGQTPRKPDFSEWCGLRWGTTGPLRKGVECDGVGDSWRWLELWEPQKLPPGPVPYLGTFLTDLVMLDTALPDMLEVWLLTLGSWPQYHLSSEQ